MGKFNEVLNNEARASTRQRTINDFCEIYNLTTDQISISEESEKPILDFEALCIVANETKNFRALKVPANLILVNIADGEVSSTAIVDDVHGCTFEMPGFSFIGEKLDNGETVQTKNQAIAIARTRALRIALRSAGFDPLKALEAKKGDVKFVAEEPPITERGLQGREVHAHAHELGLIQTKRDENGKQYLDKTLYEQFIAEQFEGRTSTTDLTDAEMYRLVITLRAMSRVSNINRSRTKSDIFKIAA